MSLKVYQQKRKFNKTPEPKGKVKHGQGPLRFVVQMHAASRLHWDFRLEFDGVFKSWAVPKGPSLNPLDQRLAVFVEDHPLDYGSFEGIIPSGNYGAGTVMVWDQGTYVERGSEGRKNSEAAMKKNFARGHLTFVLNGEKLKGEFALILLKKDKSQKSWLLVKKRDEYSTYKRSEIPSNESVKTGRTMEEIAEEAEKEGDIWLPKKGKVSKLEKADKKLKHVRPFKKKEEKPAKKKALRASTAPKATGARKANMPRKVKPMLAIPSREAIEKTWILEPHLHGYRALAEVEGKRVQLYSKAGLPFNKRYPEIVDELEELGVTALFDGEIVDKTYYIFDLLYWDGQDLRDDTLKARKKILEKAFRKNKHIKHVGSEKNHSEGVAKNPESVYRSGTSSEWLMVTPSKAKKSAAPATSSDEPRLTHLDKIYFPEDDITKGDLIEYYRSIAPYILPYLVDRPESMNRQPNGIHNPGFFQKDLTGHIPRWIQTERIFSESVDKSIDYLLCQDERTLLYMINLGCIELNPWFSRVGQLDHPDFLVIDLDPDGNPFNQVMDIALQVHEILDDVGADNVCKTSGATGIHIGVPLKAKYDFDTAREFAEEVCRIIALKNPAITSVERTPARRKKKIYMDFLQNRRGQTLAAPFCVRPKPGAPVSMPLAWDELKKGLKPEQFHLGNALSRIKKFDDPWKRVLGPSVDLAKCVSRLKRNYRKD